MRRRVKRNFTSFNNNIDPSELTQFNNCIFGVCFCQKNYLAPKSKSCALEDCYRLSGVFETTWLWRSRSLWVTGANKGIGLQIVRDLCRRFQGTVYLTARDPTRGQEAVKTLQNEGLQPKFLEMDVTNVASIKEVKRRIQDEHGGLDILVNNAGILLHSKTPQEFAKEAVTVTATNFTGVVDVCDQLFPLLRPHARVVNLSSTLGSLNYLSNMSIGRRLIADDLTVGELKDIMADYVSAAQKGDYKDHGYPGFPDAYGAYPMSKIGLNALTRIQQRTLDRERPGMDIAVNAVHPGYVDTDMTNHKGHLTVEEGADTPVFCALLPKDKDIPRGQYLSHRKVVDWVNGGG